MDALARLYESLPVEMSPLVYKGKPFVCDPQKPLWVTLIGPSGAGKGAIGDALYHTGKFFKILTATNRPRRDHEDEKAYIWMRQQYPHEPEMAYIRQMVNSYRLFEYNYHYGNLYGTPLASIKHAISSKKIPLYESEYKGALFVEKTLSSLWNVMTIMVLPENLEEIEQRIIQGGRNNATKRLEESLVGIQKAPQVAHFIVKNVVNSIETGKTGLQSTVNSVKRLIFTHTITCKNVL